MVVVDMTTNAELDNCAALEEAALLKDEDADEADELSDEDAEEIAAE